MEFRIFFPLVEEEDREWLSATEIEQYNNALERLHLGDTPSEDPRTDSYFVTNSVFGLKYRHGKKLELKVRHKEVLDGMEGWTKWKIGKKDASHYRSEIHNVLNNSGYIDWKPDHPVFSFSDMIDVSKQRQRVSLGEFKVEVTKVFVPHEQGRFRRPISRRNWASIAIEADTRENISQFLSTDTNPLPLKDSLSVIRQIFATKREEALTHKFLPIVSGYPLYLQVIADSVSKDEYQRDVETVWYEVMNRIIEST